MNLVEPQQDHFNVLSTADPRYYNPPFSFKAAVMRHFLISADTAASLPDWDPFISTTVATVVSKTFHHPFEDDTTISSY